MQAFFGTVECEQAELASSLYLLGSPLNLGTPALPSVCDPEGAAGVIFSQETAIAQAARSDPDMYTGPGGPKAPLPVRKLTPHWCKLRHKRTFCCHEPSQTIVRKSQPAMLLQHVLT